MVHRTSRVIVDLLLGWFATHERSFPWRVSGALERWQLLAVEVLLQQTAASRVAVVLPGFFELFPSLSALAMAPETEVADTLRPLGLHRQRARLLIKLAGALVDRGGEPPSNREELLTLPAVGPYVAEAYRIATIGATEPAVDTNVVRILARIYDLRTIPDGRRDPAIRRIAARLTKMAPEPHLLHFAFIDLGALVCRPRHPLCGSCPLHPVCSHGRTSVVE